MTSRRGIGLCGAVPATWPGPFSQRLPEATEPHIAARFQVPWPTVRRWVERYRAGQPLQTCPVITSSGRRGPDPRRASTSGRERPSRSSWPASWLCAHSDPSAG
ncbi:helix-turn-helix domain-containing protein [Pseudarthrobacter oxydans]|uniref:helix-turn-helix domain-containing protein n=1 Tax=Pseudarthrobacter oxydans TaxID=1671 RepID=UPI0034154836